MTTPAAVPAPGTVNPRSHSTPVSYTHLDVYKRQFKSRRRKKSDIEYIYSPAKTVLFKSCLINQEEAYGKTQTKP